MVFTISVTALPSRTDATISHDPVPELGEILANGGEWRGEVRGFRNVIETDDAHRRWHGDPVIAERMKRAEGHLVIGDKDGRGDALGNEQLPDGAPAVGGPVAAPSKRASSDRSLKGPVRTALCGCTCEGARDLGMD